MLGAEKSPETRNPRNPQRSPEIKNQLRISLAHQNPERSI